MHALANFGVAAGVPVHPAGVVPFTVLACWPLALQTDHAEYVYPVQAVGVGEHACFSTGVFEGVPVHPAGVLPVTVLVLWPLAPQADHAEYVYPVQAVGVGAGGNSTSAIA